MKIEIFMVDSRSFRSEINEDVLDQIVTKMERRSGVVQVTHGPSGLKPHEVIVACAHIVRIDIVK